MTALASLRSPVRTGSRRLRVLIVGAVATVAVALAGPAQAATLPLHHAQGTSFTCVANTQYSGNLLTARPPQMTSVSGGLENVFWRPVLARWNGKVWVQQTLTAGTAQAAANANGTVYSPAGGVTWFVGTMPRTVLSFAHLTPGYYAIYDVYTWQDGSTIGQWITYNLGGSYCQFS